MTQETLYVPFLKSPKLLAMQTVTICLIDKWLSENKNRGNLLKTSTSSQENFQAAFPF